jgi:hypothetical protein
MSFIDSKFGTLAIFALGCICAPCCIASALYDRYKYDLGPLSSVNFRANRVETVVVAQEMVA